MKPIHSILFALALLFANVLVGQDIPDPMSPPRLVNDFANLLPANERQQLEGKLRSYNDSTSTQIYVIITNDLLGYDIGDYAQRLGQKWGVGQKGTNNGMVMVVKPKTNDTYGEAYIATGYGLEEFIPDAIARRIVDNEMIPFFDTGNYAGGINAGANVVIALLSGQYSAEHYSNDDASSALGIVVIVAVILLLLSTGFAAPRKKGKLSYDATIPLMIIFSLLSSGGGGGKGGGSSSRSGGFGGGGGGSFGGGGAGGRW